MPDVFISHSATDKAFARRLASDLSEQNLSVWLDSTSLQPGDNWAASIQQAISESKSFVAVVSRDRSDSPWFSTELAIALASSQIDKPKRIIPVIADEGAQLPPFLRQFQALDLSTEDKYNSHLSNLVKAAKAPTQAFSAPSPEALKKYEDLLPGSAERLLEMAQLEATHRDALESKLEYRSMLVPALVATLVSVTMIVAFIVFGSGSLDNVVALSLGLVAGILANSLYRLVERGEKSDRPGSNE